MKNFVKQCIIFIMPIFIAFLFLVFMRMQFVKTVEFKDLSKCEKTDNAVYSVEYFDNNDKYVHIIGFFFIKDVVVKRADMSIVLVDRNTGKAYELSTKINQRGDVAELYDNLEGNNACCGFEAFSRVDKIEDGIYDVYCLYKSDDNMILQNMEYVYTKE